MPRNGDNAFLRWVHVVSMSASCSCKVPSICFNTFDYIAHFHRESPHSFQFHKQYTPKAQATFSDVLATVRRHVLGGLTFQKSPADPELCLCSLSALNHPPPTPLYPLD